jgi:2-polyprenyl-3-methyl-5-hydroxy-6-metoxy-1,4-benzoquinol methylase
MTNNTPKYVSINKLYDIWAASYDREKNLTMFLEEQLTKPLFQFKGKKILDLGCGTGRYAISLARENQVTAVDFNEKMLSIARAKAKLAQVSLDFINSDVTKFKKNDKFDIILSMLVHDHIKDLKKALEVIEKASKLGTLVYISNVHPRFTYISQVKGNKAQLIQGYFSDEYYHPLSEYLELMRELGFELTDTRDIILEERYAKDMHLDNLQELTNEFLGILYKFEKVR